MTQAGRGGRLGGLVTDLETIYPGAAVRIDTQRRVPNAGPDTRVFRVVPGAQRPRLAIPAQIRTAGRGALRRSTAADSTIAVLARATFGLATSAPGAGYAFPTIATVTAAPGGDLVTGGIEELLQDLAGEPVGMSLQIGSARANAKPVLGVYTGTGAEIGFCKVGVEGALSHGLVAHEADALARLAAARPRTFRVPGVLHAGPWAGGTALVMTPERGQRGKPGRLPTLAMREVAAFAGLQEAPLQESPWAQRMRETIGGLPADLGTDLVAALDRLLDRDGERVLPIGAWHGDFGPWNMAWQSASLAAGAPPRAVIWDWERLAEGVPAGLDAAHFTAHTALRAIGAHDTAAAALADVAEPAISHVLRPWLGTAELGPAARTVADCYLLEIAGRFGADAARAGTTAVAGLARWYAAVAAARLDLRTAGVPR